MKIDRIIEKKYSKLFQNGAPIKLNVTMSSHDFESPSVVCWGNCKLALA